MKEADRLSLVSYDARVYVDFPLTHMTEDNKKSTKATINNMRAGTTTNLCGGLLKGSEYLSNSSFHILFTLGNEQLSDIYNIIY